VIDLFGKHLPTLPQPKPELWDGKARRGHACSLALGADRQARSGQRYATINRDRGAGLLRPLLRLRGQERLPHRPLGDFTCSLQWLMKAANFSKVVQGNYENKAAA
jgi:hypothetical protein